MNDQLQNFARQTLKDGLAQLPADWQDKFKLMYGRAGGRRSVDNARAMPIGEFVDRMPEDDLDRAMEQVEASLKKRAVVK